MKKPIYKRWWFIVIAVMFAIGIIGNIATGWESLEDEPTKKEVAKVGTETDVETEMESEPEVDEAWDDMKENIIGKSDQDFKGLTEMKPSNVRNDKTGKWKITKISENMDIQDYALSYADEYIKGDEIHFVVNFTYNTTTRISKANSLIYVDVMEYVSKEEHDASVLGSGMPLKSYVIYPDGDIEEIK